MEGKTMTKAFSYLRTSGDDGKEKAGLPVQREGCAVLAKQKGFKIVQEFADDGVSGKIPMHARPSGKLLIAALLGNGVKTVLCYDAKRIGRTQPAFWSFAGMCRDNNIALIAADGTDLLGSVMGGVNAMLAEMDRDTLIKRLAEGKKHWRALGKRVEGQYPYGESPLSIHNGERTRVEYIYQLRDEGKTCYGIAKELNNEGFRTRNGKEFKPQTIANILQRRKEKTNVKAQGLGVSKTETGAAHG